MIALVDRQRLLHTFLELVAIDSPSLHESRLGYFLLARLENLGLTVRVDDAQRHFGGDFGNIIARLPGSHAGPTLLFSAHMDNVDPATGVRPVVADDVIRSDGTTVLGADDKSGIAEIIEMLQVITTGDVAHPPIEVVFTSAEEKGLLGARHLDYSSLEATYGFVMDAESPAGKIVTAAPAQDSIIAAVHGKAAHAGVEPEKGIDAIRVVSKAITAMKLGRIDHETTANIGVIRGGRATNIVADEAALDGEARSRDEVKLAEQIGHMKGCLEGAARAAGAEVDIEVTRAYDGFELAADTPPVSLMVEAFRRTGLSERLAPSGGGADTNIFNRQGVSSVTVSTGMRDVHSTSEHISVDDMCAVAEALVELVKLSAEDRSGQ